MSTERVSYEPLASNDRPDEESSTEFLTVKKRRCSGMRLWMWYLLRIAITLTIIIQGTAIVLLNRAIDKSCISSHGMRLQCTEPRTIYQHSKYISDNEEEASAAWNAILPGHGNTGGKLGYVIEAYHAIHCESKEALFALQRNETWDWSHGHDLHCFDSLRQYVMCNIDDTLLHSWGKRDAGHNQAKKCHDWDRLRLWAEERSAAYFDVEPGMGIRHTGNYHEGDGLLFNSLN
ncbi:hypothetical protein GQ44DRAFT_735723 [Phaeosphaeriaceae sp. PMI808]|nr:hypothetical protein GQ44DRAFT_735723 [Phaeosphaeriaceae sp. PMI808]